MPCRNPCKAGSFGNGKEPSLAAFDPVRSPKKLGRLRFEMEGSLNMSVKLGSSVTTLDLPSGAASSVMFFCGSSVLNAANTSFLVKLLMRVVVRLRRRAVGAGKPIPPSEQSQIVHSLPM